MLSRYKRHKRRWCGQLITVHRSLNGILSTRASVSLSNCPTQPLQLLQLMNRHHSRAAIVLVYPAKFWRTKEPSDEQQNSDQCRTKWRIATRVCSRHNQISFCSAQSSTQSSGPPHSPINPRLSPPIVQLLPLRWQLLSDQTPPSVFQFTYFF